MARRQIVVAGNCKNEGCYCDNYNAGLLKNVDVKNGVILNVRIFEVEMTNSLSVDGQVNANEQIRI
jgi:hypothetical protein